MENVLISLNYKNASIGVFELTHRIGRFRYLGLMSFWASLLSLFYVLPLFFSGIPIAESISMFAVAIGPLFCLVALVLVTIRRINDFNMSGFWIFLTLIIFFLIVIFFIPGTKTENKYGRIPKKARKVNYVLIMFFPLVWIVILAGMLSF